MTTLFCHKKWLLGIALATGLGISLLGCHRKGERASEAGLESATVGIRIVATYDPRFDAILKEYRLLSITFVNQSPQMIELNPSKDEWLLVLRDGKKEKAINHLAYRDNQAWNALSPRAQEVIGYPDVILRNTTVTFDLLFPKKTDLKGFQRVDFFCASLNKQFVGSSNLGESP